MMCRLASIALAASLLSACDTRGTSPCAIDEDCASGLACVPIEACPSATNRSLGTTCCADPLPDDPEPHDRVDGNLIQFEDNGGWCWYQDPRVIVDPEGGRVVVGSVANYLGYLGEGRDADVNASSFDLATGDRSRFLLRNVPAWGKGDDHNAPAFYLRPDGRYLAMYTGHNEESRESWYRISESPHDASTWQPERSFSWGPVGNGVNVTYTNLIHLSAEGRTYNIARERDRSPHIAVSMDHGETWQSGGRLTASRFGVGYSNGYFRFATNGVDRIDFIATEHHPRDYNTGIYHGYIRNGQSFDSAGGMVDANIFDSAAPSVDQFTAVFLPDREDGTNDEAEYHRAWTADLAYLADGRPHALFTTRYGTAAWPEFLAEDPLYIGTADHRLFYARFDGVTWQHHEVARMGQPLYDIEQDYTGLGALDPNDDSTLVFSSPIDPRDDTLLEHREIFRADIEGEGESFVFSPITWRSRVDNARPVIPRWTSPNRAVLFWRGTYLSQFDYDTAIVGVLDRDGESFQQVTYVDASETNTRQADGLPLAATGPNANPGPGEGAWHLRSLRTGNGEGVLAASETTPEDAPPLMTSVALPDAGTYEVFAYFWSNPGEDWRIAAGLSLESLSVFRSRSSQQADPAALGPSVVIHRPTIALYRAYVGRVSVDRAITIDVYVDDAHSSTVGTQRTWYDGVGFARLE